MWCWPMVVVVEERKSRLIEVETRGTEAGTSVKKFAQLQVQHKPPPSYLTGR